MQLFYECGLYAGVYTGGPSSQREELYRFFFYFFANAQRNVTSGIYYYTTIEFDFAKRDSRLAAYGGVVLQRFEFIKVCMGTQRFCWKSQFCLCFVKKIYSCCVVFYVACYTSSILTWFRDLVVLWRSGTHDHFLRLFFLGSAVITMIYNQPGRTAEKTKGSALETVTSCYKVSFHRRLMFC